MTPDHAIDMLEQERFAQADGFRWIIGIDEAGRGPLAGPVVASAVRLRSRDFTCPIRDSKKLSARQRENAFQEISEKADVGIGVIQEDVIDRINILRAAFAAMEAAVLDLVDKIAEEIRTSDTFMSQTCLLVDGNRFDSALPYSYRTLISGDSRSLSIASASIIAKVTRDRILMEYDRDFPQYGFRKHKGYPTREHKQAIARHGLCRVHRKTFKSW